MITSIKIQLHNRYMNKQSDRRRNNKFSQAMKDCGFTNADLAEITDSSEVTINNIKNGHKFPRKNMQIKLLEAFNKKGQKYSPLIFYHPFSDFDKFMDKE